VNVHDVRCTLHNIDQPFSESQIKSGKQVDIFLRNYQHIPDTIFRALIMFYITDTIGDETSFILKSLVTDRRRAVRT
jgi:hypothetical protein